MNGELEITCGNSSGYTKIPNILDVLVDAVTVKNGRFLILNKHSFKLAKPLEDSEEQIMQSIESLDLQMLADNWTFNRPKLERVHQLSLPDLKTQKWHGKQAKQQPTEEKKQWLDADGEADQTYFSAEDIRITDIVLGVNEFLLQKDGIEYRLEQMGKAEEKQEAELADLWSIVSQMKKRVQLDVQLGYIQ